MDTYSAKDKYGSYTLRYQNNILYADVQGAIGANLAEKFNSHIAALFKSISDPPFGYLGDLSLCQAYTEEAEKRLPLTHSSAIAAGCVVDAYCVGTALSIDQLRKVRAQAGILTLLEEHVFDSIEQAEAFIYHVLSKVGKSL